MKTIAALIFLTAIGIVLVQPVLGADDEPVKRKAADAPVPRMRDEQGPKHVELTARYPRRCLRDERRSTDLIAARRGSTATIGFPDEGPAARIEVAGDVAWSPSGTFLAERGGLVFDQSGNPQGALFFDAREWQWSPVADCALALTNRRAVTFSIPDTERKGIRLLDVPTEQFELSPNGRRLAFVVFEEDAAEWGREGGGLFVADLRRGAVEQVTDRRASLVGWFSNRAVLYSKSTDEGKLRYATGRGDARVVRGAFAGGSLVRCRGRVLLVSESTEATPPLVELTSARGRIRRDVLAGPPAAFDGYSGAACAPAGGFIAASTIRGGDKGPLVLLGAGGDVARQLAPGRTANPQWSREGLTFVSFDEDGDGRVWLVAPGSPPAPTAYRVGAPTQYDWHAR